MYKGFFKKGFVLVAIFAILIIAFVLPPVLKHKPPENMPGDDNTYRVVTLYNSLFPDGGKIFGEMKDLERSYEGVPSFVYVDTSDEDEGTGHLRLMGGRNYPNS